jgi:hypothetical protein
VARNAMQHVPSQLFGNLLTVGLIRLTPPEIDAAQDKISMERQFVVPLIYTINQ